MADAQALLWMRGSARQSDEWPPLVDEIDAMSAIRLEEAGSQIRQWVERSSRHD